jgi:hypothetical protein
LTVAHEQNERAVEVGCAEAIKGATATSWFAELLTLAKLDWAFSVVVGMIVRMESENSCQVIEIVWSG